MNTGEAITWIEAHPAESIVIGAGGVLALMWLFGAFSGPKASDTSGGSANLAAAYYAAEAQQAVVGGQIQMANIAAAADVAKTGLTTRTATAINESNNNAAVLINGQNTS